MKMIRAGAFLFFQGVVGDSPLTKVIQLLGDMHAQGVEEKNAEEAELSRFNQECASYKSEKSGDLEDLAEEISKQDGLIEQGLAAMATLGDEIAHEEMELERDEADLQAATSIRQKEATDYAAVAQDYAESLSALGRAIQTLKAQNTNKAVVETLTQLKETNSLLQTAVAQPNQATEYGYESAVGGVLQMLNDLESKFSDEARAAEKAEKDAVIAFTTLKTQIQGMKKNGKAEIARKKERLGKKTSDKEAAEGAKKIAEKEHSEVKKALQQKMAACNVNSKLLEEQLVVRGEELDAIQQAIDILSGDSAKGAE